MSKTPPLGWRKDYQSDLPIWHAKHPAYAKLKGKGEIDAVTIHARSAEAETAIVLPAAIDDQALRIAIAATAAIDRFQDAADAAPTIALESYALLYLGIGATPEALASYNAGLGIKRAAQSTNDWQPLLKWIAGNAWDQSNKRETGRLSKMAAMMTFWMHYLSDDPKCSPLDGWPGSSSFAKWVIACGGYTGFARDRPAIPLAWVKAQYEKIPRTFECSAEKVVLRIVGYPAAIPGTEKNVAAELERNGVWLAADDPLAVEWNVAECLTNSGTLSGWQTLPDGGRMDLTAATELLMDEIKRRGDSSAEKSSADPVEEVPAHAPAPPPAHPEEVPAHAPAPPVVVPLKSKPAMIIAPVAPKVPPRPDWSQGRQPGLARVVDLEKERLERLLSEAQDKLTETERVRDEWKLTAEAMRQQHTEGAWRDTPDDLAAAWAAADADKAIDFLEALEAKLKRTPEWRAYMDERIRETMENLNRMRMEREAEDKAAVNADPHERRIARIKNALELALRADTPEQEALAAFAGARRMCEDGDLDFLERLTDAKRDPDPARRGIA
jgi:hypothetical protein